MDKTQEHRIRRIEIADQIFEQILQEAEEDAHLGTPVDNRWYFVTLDEMHALLYHSSQSPGVHTKGPEYVNDIYGYEIMITTDPKKTGRQRDAIHLVSVIDTYPDYPRILP